MCVIVTIVSELLILPKVVSIGTFFFPVYIKQLKQKTGTESCTGKFI